ncbi:hypothetical protein, partial [Variovorax sp. YR634]|uniref:hypothetical protein n=1 Tax=Variovorax sp. YR634 TaxID=1884385 RepID=UPI001C40BA29
QDLPWLSQPYRIPGEPWTCNIKPVQVFIRTPSWSNFGGNQQVSDWNAMQQTFTVASLNFHHQSEAEAPKLQNSPTAAQLYRPRRSSPPRRMGFVPKGV